MKTKIKGRYVIGFDGTDHTILHNAEVVFMGDTIEFVGFDFPGPVDKVIEAGNAIISPGFIDLNALCDIDLNALRYDTPPDSRSGMTWAKGYFQGRTRDVFTPEEEEQKSRYALAQLIRNGITTALPVTSLAYRKWAETLPEFERIVGIVGELGLRVYLGPSFRSAVHLIEEDGSRTMHWDEEQGMKGLVEAVQFIREYDDSQGGLIRGLLVPSTIDTCSLDLLKSISRCSAEMNVPVRLHATQSLREFTAIRTQYQRTPVQLLHSINFLNDRMLLPHCLFINGYSRVDCGKGPDLQILKDTGLTVVYCPYAVGVHGEILESFERFLKFGIRVGMGTDCTPPDMIRNMSLGSILCRNADGNGNSASTADMFRAVTLWGARALRRDDLGKLTQGARADIIVIDLEGNNIGPVADPLRSIILNGTGSDVRTSIINGRMVMEDHKIIGIHDSTLRETAQELFAKLVAAYPERDYLHRTPDTLFPPVFRNIRRDL